MDYVLEGLAMLWDEDNRFDFKADLVSRSEAMLPKHTDIVVS